MSQKLGLKFGSGVKELKLGKTFSKGYKDEAFHTIRYDFKPASVDSQKVGSLEVVNKEVTLTVPLVTGAGSSQEAVFKGNKTPASKDCLLIIDHNTGEIVLERISQHIRVKKTRTENSNRKTLQRGGVTDFRPSKPTSAQNHSNSGSLGSAKSSVVPRSPSSKSPNHNVKQNHSSKTNSASVPPGSMPMLNFGEEHKNNSIMSDSSSDSDSNSGSSSSSDSDSDSDTESQSIPNYTPNGDVPRNNLANNHKSPSSILSDLELSEED